MARLILFNKPYGVLSQFTDRSGAAAGAARATLSDFIDLPGVYPAGRLDRDSEGLLALTDDGALQHAIAHPGRKTEKTYLAQVEGEPGQDALDRLTSGLDLKDGPARALSARRAPEPDWLWPREPPVRARKTVPDAWIELTVNEGRNRMVRRMTAAAGHPTLRLIRWRIGAWTLNGLAPGRWRRV